MNSDYRSALMVATYADLIHQPGWVADDPLAKDAANLIRRLRTRVAELEADRDGLRDALIRAASTMASVDVFVRSRERIQGPAGEAWWDEEVRNARDALDRAFGDDYPDPINGE